MNPTPTTTPSTEHFKCFRCCDGHTPLYCLNCAGDVLKAAAPAGGEWAARAAMLIYSPTTGIYTVMQRGTTVVLKDFLKSLGDAADWCAANGWILPSPTPVAVTPNEEHWAARKALRRAFLYCITGLQMSLAGKTFCEGKTSADHLRWMMDELVKNIDTFPADKTSRWIGFIQGVMAANGALDVDAERDRTRPLFKKAYEIMEAARHAPASRDGEDGVTLIAAERARQVSKEGWDSGHDDEHDDGSIAKAAACYALGSNLHWPWSFEWWKPTPNDRRRELVKAGALIAAEIDRLNRAAMSAATPSGGQEERT